LPDFCSESGKGCLVAREVWPRRAGGSGSGKYDQRLIFAALFKPLQFSSLPIQLSLVGVDLPLLFDLSLLLTLHLVTD
jgi:hypothetical protein